MTETIDSDMAAPGAGSAPEGASKDSVTLWDGAGYAGVGSVLEAINDELSYEMAEIGDVYVLTPRTRLGEATLTIKEDGTWEVSAPAPEGCNLIEDESYPFDGTEDTLTRTVDEVVAETIECFGLGFGLGEDGYETELVYWRQGAPQAFRLDLVPCSLPAPSDAHGASGAATSEGESNG